MTIYYPYAVLKTNVDKKFLKYELSIYNSVTNQTVGMLNPPPLLPTSEKFKKIDNNLYQTEYLSIDSNKIGKNNLKDCIIILKLYRKGHTGKGLLIDTYIIPETIEKYVKPDFNKNIHQVKYDETTLPTKIVLDDGELKNTYEILLNRNRIFQCIDPGCRPGEPKDPFTKKQIEAGLQARLNKPFPDQGFASLCGPAVYFFCLINLSSSKYKIAVKQLWETGEAKIGNLSIQPRLDGCRRVKNFYRANNDPRIPPIDWITLASLRESENNVLRLSDPEQEIAGITLWGAMSSWFEKTGFKVVEKWPVSSDGYDWSLISELNKYAGSDYYVITLISASLLVSGSSSGTSMFPDHWVVWTDKLKDNKGQPITMKSNPWTNVNLNLFSWGLNEQQLKPETQLFGFSRHIFFAMVVKKENF